LDRIVKHRSEKRDLQPSACGKVLKGEDVSDCMEGSRVSRCFPEEKVEVEEMRRRQARKAREKEVRQDSEEGDGQDEHEEEEVRTEEEEKSMWNRKVDSVAIDRGRRFHIC
jgi:hypothetical protein